MNRNSRREKGKGRKGEDRLLHPSSFILHPSVLLALTLAGVLGACKVGPDYKRPSLDMPATYKSAVNAEKANPGLERDWWRLFGDADLNKLEEEAIAANQNIKAAMARLAEARASTAAVRGQFFPVITMNPSAIRSRSAPANTPGTSTATKLSNAATLINGVSRILGQASGTTTGLTGGTSSGTGTAAAAAAGQSPTTGLVQIPFDLSYEIDIWGRVRRSYEAAKAQAQVSADDLEVVRQTILADLAQDYFNLRSFDAQDHIFDKNVQLYREQVNLTQRQFKAGLVPETNVLQAKVQVDSTLVQQLEIRRQRADLEHAIAILLGKAPVELSLAVRPLDSVPPKIPAGLPADILRRRPDVAEAEQNLAAASAQIGVAKANFFPVLKLTGAAGFESVDIQHAVDWQKRLWSIGPSIAAPIFQGGQLRANLRQAKARYDELDATYRNTVLTAFGDVENSLTDLHVRADEAEAQARAVQSARDYLRLTQVQYKTGIANYLQVIIAEQTMLANELSAAQILNQRMVATVLLTKALGGGWDSQSPSKD